VIAAEAHAVPADVGDAQRRAVGASLGEALDRAGEPAEARRATVLVALLEEQLQPEAEPQVRAPRAARRAQRLAEAAAAQRLGSVLEIADARQSAPLVRTQVPLPLPLAAPG